MHTQAGGPGFATDSVELLHSALAFESGWDVEAEGRLVWTVGERVTDADCLVLLRLLPARRRPMISALRPTLALRPPHQLRKHRMNQLDPKAIRM